MLFPKAVKGNPSSNGSNDSMELKTASQVMDHELQGSFKFQLEQNIWLGQFKGREKKGKNKSGRHGNFILSDKDKDKEVVVGGEYSLTLWFVEA